MAWLLVYSEPWDAIAGFASMVLLRSLNELVRVNVWTMWRRGVVVITTAELHSTKSELRFCAGLNPARGVSEICDGENL